MVIITVMKKPCTQVFPIGGTDIPIHTKSCYMFNGDNLMNRLCVYECQSQYTQTVYQYTCIWPLSGHHNGNKETTDNMIIS